MLQDRPGELQKRLQMDLLKIPQKRLPKSSEEAPGDLLNMLQNRLPKRFRRVFQRASEEAPEGSSEYISEETQRA